MNAIRQKEVTGECGQVSVETSLPFTRQPKEGVRRDKNSRSAQFKG
jgi:hypothetical protein